MKYTRRDLSAVVSLLAAQAASAQTAPSLPSRIYAFDDLPVKKNGPNTSRAVLRGAIHDGCPLEMHISELAPGMAPHPPHHHVHDEMVIVRQGTLDVMIKGNHTTMGRDRWFSSHPATSTVSKTRGPTTLCTTSSRSAKISTIL